mgnify:FL=1
MGIRGELYTTQINLDNRSYFFNVKENREGDVFLQIVESKIKGGVDDRRAIIVFADDMQRFLGGLNSSLEYIEKDHQERAKAKAEKKATPRSDSGENKNAKKVYRRKGESRLVADRREKRDDGIKRTGKVIHVTSKRPESTNDSEY